MSYGPWSGDIAEPERVARLRELRALVLLLCPTGPLLATRQEAETNPAAADRALEEIDALPPLRRRKLLSCYSALHRPGDILTGKRRRKK
jgi:hypothetical protein